MTTTIIPVNTSPLSFTQLPRPAQKSLIQYLGLEASDCYSVALEGALISELREGDFISEDVWDDAISRVGAYDTSMYYYAEISTEQLCEYVWKKNDEIRDQYPAFSAYHADYTQYELPMYSLDNRYPVLLGCPLEGILDGWHRFHAYVRSKHPTIPVLTVV